MTYLEKREKRIARYENDSAIMFYQRILYFPILFCAITITTLSAVLFINQSTFEYFDEIFRWMFMGMIFSSFIPLGMYTRYSNKFLIDIENIDYEVNIPSSRLKIVALQAFDLVLPAFFFAAVAVIIFGIRAIIQATIYIGSGAYPIG